MEKQSSVIILGIIIIFIIIGLAVFNPFTSHEVVKIGDTYFTAPEGYHQGALNEAGDVNLTNGVDSVFIAEYGNNDVKGYMNNYVHSREKLNESISTSDFNYDNIKVYKAVNDKSGSVHYWFANNGKVYSVYTWSKNQNMDSIFIDLINSMDSQSN